MGSCIGILGECDRSLIEHIYLEISQDIELHLNCLQLWKQHALNGIMISQSLLQVLAGLMHNTR